jgi:hypothetical protein
MKTVGRSYPHRLSFLKISVTGECFLVMQVQEGTEDHVWRIMRRTSISSYLIVLLCWQGCTVKTMHT